MTPNNVGTTLSDMFEDAMGNVDHLRELVRDTDPPALKTLAEEMAEFLEEQELARQAKAEELLARPEARVELEA
ncbi:MAG: hypothetical protein U5S82_00355 [Gammaproteobacteria bacterium]|nr:hypothetical protein [Gammaproteobacteria bacterium]